MYPEYESLVKQYPRGTKVKIKSMVYYGGTYPGLVGTVCAVKKDMCMVDVNWENGSSLPFIPDCDDVEIVCKKEVC